MAVTSGRNRNVEWLGKRTRYVAGLVSHFKVQSGGRVAAVLRRHSGGESWADGLLGSTS
jgi:hypothetical protein